VTAPEPVEAGRAKEAFCHIHNRMEPDGFWACGECWHAWPAEADLVADIVARYADIGIDLILSAFNPQHYPACPLCTHDW